MGFFPLEFKNFILNSIFYDLYHFRREPAISKFD